MMLPLQGPENPFSDRNRFINQNALAGHVEEQAMTEHAFRQQHLTHSILGYSANPSIDPNAPSILGSIDTAQANGFATIDTIKAPKGKKRELKRKRKAKGDLDVVDGEGGGLPSGPHRLVRGARVRRRNRYSTFRSKGKRNYRLSSIGRLRWRVNSMWLA